MMKFFRKYTKHLLAIFMALLLIVWLAGDALRSLLREQGHGEEEVRGEAFGESVQLKDMLPAFAEANILDMLYPAWREPWRGLAVREEPLTPEEWYMLDAAARKSGVFVAQEAVNRLKARIPAQVLAAIRERSKLSMDDIDRALQSFLRVQEMFHQAAGALRPSEPDLQDYVRQVAEKVRVKLVTFEGAKFAEESYQPTDEEINAHFEKYKDQDPARGSVKEFGYRLPEAAQIEYIQVSVAELAKTQKVSDDEAYRYWNFPAHRTEFLKPSTRPATSTAPATQPKPEPPKPYETFTEAKAKVK